MADDINTLRLQEAMALVNAVAPGAGAATGMNALLSELPPLPALPGLTESSITRSTGDTSLLPSHGQSITPLMVQQCLHQEEERAKYLEAISQQLSSAAQEEESVRQIHDNQQQAIQFAMLLQATQAEAGQHLVDDYDGHSSNNWLRRGTTVCPRWKRGYCTNGDQCNYLHPVLSPGKGARSIIEVMRYNFKTTWCKSFPYGKCTLALRCMFAHGDDEIRTPGPYVTTEQEEVIQRVAAARMAKNGVPNIGEQNALPGPPLESTGGASGAVEVPLARIPSSASAPEPSTSLAPPLEPPLEDPKRRFAELMEFVEADDSSAKHPRKAVIR